MSSVVYQKDLYAAPNVKWNVHVVFLSYDVPICEFIKCEKRQFAVLLVSLNLKLTIILFSFSLVLFFDEKAEIILGLGSNAVFQSLCKFDHSSYAQIVRTLYHTALPVLTWYLYKLNDLTLNENCSIITWWQNELRERIERYVSSKRRAYRISKANDFTRNSKPAIGAKRLRCVLSNRLNKITMR